MAGQRGLRDLDGWRGIRFGMSVDSVRQQVESWSPHVKVDHDEGTWDCSGHLGLSSPEGWQAGLSLDGDRVSRHIGIGWREPLGLARALVTLRERIRDYGPPRGVLIDSGSQTRSADVVLEWVGAATSLRLALVRDAAGWTLHESYSEYLMPVREVGVMTWPQAQELLSTRGDDDHWARDTAQALEQVAQLVDTTAVPLVDFQGSATGHASTMRHRSQGTTSSSTGAFVCWRGAKDPLRHRIWDLVRRHRWTSHELTTGNEDCERFPVLPRVEVHVIVIEDPLAHAVLSESRLDDDPTVSDLVVVPSSPSLTPPTRLVEQLHERPTAEPGHLKDRLRVSDLHPITVSDPATGLAVYLNLGHSVDELRPYAHALLAGLARLRG